MCKQLVKIKCVMFMLDFKFMPREIFIYLKARTCFFPWEVESMLTKHLCNENYIQSGYSVDLF